VKLNFFNFSVCCFLTNYSFLFKGKSDQTWVDPKEWLAAGIFWNCWFVAKRWIRKVCYASSLLKDNLTNTNYFPVTPDNMDISTCLICKYMRVCDSYVTCAVCFQWQHRRLTTDRRRRPTEESQRSRGRKSQTPIRGQWFWEAGLFLWICYGATFTEPNVCLIRGLIEWLSVDLSDNQLWNGGWSEGLSWLGLKVNRCKGQTHLHENQKILFRPLISNEKKKSTQEEKEVLFRAFFFPNRVK
jgi:hypothetical protein